MPKTVEEKVEQTLKKMRAELSSAGIVARARFRLELARELFVKWLTDGKKYEESVEELAELAFVAARAFLKASDTDDGAAVKCGRTNGASE